MRGCRLGNDGRHLVISLAMKLTIEHSDLAKMDLSSWEALQGRPAPRRLQGITMPCGASRKFPTTGSAKWVYDGVCTDPNVFGALMGLNGPPTWKQKKLTVAEFEDLFGRVEGSVR